MKIPAKRINRITPVLYPRLNQLNSPEPVNPYRKVSMIAVNGLAIISHLYLSGASDNG
jgi:hypothetical protein